MISDAEFYKFYETIEGEKILLPGENLRHALAKSKLLMLLGMHIKTHKLGLIFTSLETHLPDGNIFYPDVIFIDKARDYLAIENPYRPLHGVPDMVAEIFSRSTMKRDLTVKKDVYERNGVREYWIINPWSETVEVYLLRDGKYFLDGVYQNCSEAELNELTDEERVEVRTEIPVAALDGFKIKLKNIFGWYFE